VPIVKQHKMEMEENIFRGEAGKILERAEIIKVVVHPEKIIFLQSKEN